MASLSDPLVKQLLGGRYIATLATQNPNGSIHMVAVWYLFDGGHVYVGTSTRTRKARNLESNTTVSVMIDSRDVAASCGITIVGKAKIVTGEASHRWNAQIHSKYLSDAALADSRVGPTFAAVDDVTIQIVPSSVISWDMREIDKQFFGGAMESNPGYLLPLQR